MAETKYSIVWTCGLGYCSHPRIHVGDVRVRNSGEMYEGVELLQDVETAETTH